MKCLREWECQCGTKFEDFTHEDDKVKCLQCGLDMFRIWSLPMIQAGTEQSRLNNKAKDIEMSVMEKQGVNLSNPGKGTPYNSGIDYEVSE